MDHSRRRSCLQHTRSSARSGEVESSSGEEHCRRVRSAGSTRSKSNSAPAGTRKCSSSIRP